MSVVRLFDLVASFASRVLELSSCLLASLPGEQVAREPCDFAMKLAYIQDLHVFPMLYSVSTLSSIGRERSDVVEKE
jgi:hypothetical protein